MLRVIKNKSRTVCGQRLRCDEKVTNDSPEFGSKVTGEYLYLEFKSFLVI